MLESSLLSCIESFGCSTIYSSFPILVTITSTPLSLTNGDIEVSRSLANLQGVGLKQDTIPVILFYSFSGSPVFSLFLKSTNPKIAQVAIPSPSKTSTPANAQGHQGVEDPLAISLMAPSSGFAFLY